MSEMGTVPINTRSCKCSANVSYRHDGDDAGDFASPLRSCPLIQNETHDCGPQTGAFCHLQLLQ